MQRLFLRRALQARAPLLWQSAATTTSTTSPPAWQQRATYSSESANDQNETRRHVVFGDNVSATLAPLLKEVQDKIILPSYLPQKKRDRVFNPKHTVSLKNDPVVLEIDDITHRFEHIPVTEVPSNNDALLSTIRAMETPEDWDQLERLVIGLQRAGRVISPEKWLVFIYVAARKGRMSAVYEIARRSKFTGLRLGLPAIMHDLLMYTQLEAVEAGWTRKATEQALAWTRMALDMSARDLHVVKGKKKPEWLNWPMHRDPLTLAAPVHLTAAWDLGHEGGKDAKGDVAFFAKQLVSVWPAGKGIQQVYPEASFVNNKRGGLAFLKYPPYFIPKASLALHGLRLAERVVQPVLAEQVKGVADGLEAELKQAIGSLAHGMDDKSRAYAVYTQLFDDEGKVKFEVAPEPEPVKTGSETESKQAAGVEEPAEESK